MIEEEKKRFPLYEGKCIIYGRGRDKRWGARIGNRDCWRHLHGIDYVPNIWLLDPLLAQTSKHLFVSYYCSVVFRQEHHIKLIANNYSHGKKKSRGLVNFFLENKQCTPPIWNWIINIACTIPIWNWIICLFIF